MTKARTLSEKLWKIYKSNERGTIFFLFGKSTCLFLFRYPYSYVSFDFDSSYKCLCLRKWVWKAEKPLFIFSRRRRRRRRFQIISGVNAHNIQKNIRHGIATMIGQKEKEWRTLYLFRWFSSSFQVCESDFLLMVFVCVCVYLYVQKKYILRTQMNACQAIAKPKHAKLEEKKTYKQKKYKRI